MNYSGGFNTALSSDAVHTAIDGFANQEFTALQQPDNLVADDPFYFKQGQTVGNAIIEDVDTGVPEFDALEEYEEFQSHQTWMGNQKIRISQKYGMQIPISTEAFIADRVGKREKIGRDVGRMARQTRDKQAIIRTYGDVFDGNYDKCDDGVVTASNSHVTLTGVTVDNLETGSLTPANFWTGVLSLAHQKDQYGSQGGFKLDAVLVPMYKYGTMKEILGSDLVPYSGENTQNIFNTIYGDIRVRQSVYLDSQNNTEATYTNNTYHLLSAQHNIHRREFYGLKTEMRDPINTGNDAHLLRWSFNELSYPLTWSGIVSSNGSA
jgi:hypothetical protein